MQEQPEKKELTIQLVTLPILVIAAGTAFLYFSTPVMLPLVISITLAYLLHPIVGFVERLKVPHSLAVGIVTLVVVGIIALLTFLLVGEVADLISVLPQYRTTIMNTVENWSTAVTDFLNNYRGIVGNPEKIAVGPDQAKSIGGFLLKGATSITNFLVGAVSIFFLVLFMLLESNLFARKFPRLFGPNHVETSQEILREINTQLKGFVQIRFYIFIAFSIVVTVALLIMDVQYAYIWGPLAGLLNIIPYIGSIAGAIPPIVVAGIQHGSIWPMIYVTIFFLVLQGIEGNYITPKLTANSVDLNAVTVFVSLMYWGWIWGGIGLLVAVPVTSMIKVVCDHIEPLKPIGLLLGTDKNEKAA